MMVFSFWQMSLQNSFVFFFPTIVFFKILYDKENYWPRTCMMYLTVSTSLLNGCLDWLLDQVSHLHLKHIVCQSILLTQLKKLRPQFHVVSALYCELCKFAKHHSSSLSTRVTNKMRLFSSQLIMMFGNYVLLCPKVGRIFATFMDDSFFG